MNCCYVSSRVFYLGSLCFFFKAVRAKYLCQIFTPNIYANRSTRLCSKPDASLPIVGHWVTLITSISSSFKHRWLSLSRWLGKGCEKKCCAIWTYSSVIFQKVQGNKRKKLLLFHILTLHESLTQLKKQVVAVELYARISHHFSLIFTVAFLIYLHAFEQVLPHHFS